MRIVGRDGCDGCDGGALLVGGEVGGKEEEDDDDEDDAKCRSICSRVYACMPFFCCISSASCLACIDSADSSCCPVGMVERADDGERIMAMTGAGVEDSVLECEIRSNVPASWAEARSKGVSSKKS